MPRVHTFLFSGGSISPTWIYTQRNVRKSKCTGSKSGETSYRNCNDYFLVVALCAMFYPSLLLCFVYFRRSWKLVFIHMFSRTNYHHKNFALRLAWKMRQTWTRNWPISLFAGRTLWFSKVATNLKHVTSLWLAKCQNACHNTHRGKIAAVYTLLISLIYAVFR